MNLPRLRPRTFAFVALSSFATACSDGGHPAANEAPLANAGADRPVAEGLEATLDGSGSSDVDGTIAAQLWTQLSGPPVVLLDATSAKARFVAPLVDAPTPLEFQLEVTDDDGATSTDTVVLTVDEVDETPDPFTFVDVTDIAPNTVVTSAPVTLSGFTVPLAITVVGGTYSINSTDDAAFTAAPGTVVANDVVRVRTTSSASGATGVTLTVGSSSDVWNVTSMAPPTAPSATVHFPVGSAEIPTDTIRVRGLAAAVAGRTVASVSIQHAAGSTAATVDANGAFRADVPLVHGDNTLVVHVTDSTNESNDAAAMVDVRRDHPIRAPVAMAWDATEADLVVCDNIYDPAYFRKASTIVALDPTTNAVDVLSGPTRGTGSMWKQIQDLVVVGGEIFVLDASQNAVFSVSRATGNRTVLSGATTNPAGFNVGTGPFGTARNLAYDAARNRLVFTAGGSANNVTAIALDTSGGSVRGARVALSGTGIGSGTTVTSSAAEIAVYGDGAFFFDTSVHQIVRVDLVTLVRTLVTANGDGKGTNFATSGSVAILPGLAFDASGVLFASDFYGDAVFSINVATGARTVVSSPSVGAGSAIGTGEAIVNAPSGTTIWVADDTTGRIVAVAKASGDRTTLHESTPFGGIGSGIYIPTAITMSPDGATAYVADYVGGRVFAVTMASGATTKVTETSASYTGPAFDHPEAVVFDAARNHLLVIDGKITAIDPGTGARTLVSGTSGTTVGTGDAFAATHAIVLDPAADVAYVADHVFSGTYQPAIFSVALASGDRTTIYDGFIDTTTPIYQPVGLAVDPARSLLFAVDTVADVIFTVSTTSATLGARVPFSSGDDPADGSDAIVATGPDFEYPSNLVRDPSAHELYLWDDVNMRLFGIDDVSGNRVVHSANDVGRGIAIAIPASYTPIGGSDNPWDMIAIGAGPTPGTLVGGNNMHNGVLLFDVESGDRVRIVP